MFIQIGLVYLLSFLQKAVQLMTNGTVGKEEEKNSEDVTESRDKDYQHTAASSMATLHMVSQGHNKHTRRETASPSSAPCKKTTLQGFQPNGPVKRAKNCVKQNFTISHMVL
ncbi:hypothetical protein Drorol1_Dr00004066 [Drosera rotundifolia]